MRRAVFALLIISITQLITIACDLFCTCGCGSGPPQQISILSWNVGTVSDSYKQVDPLTTQPYHQTFKTLRIGDRENAYLERGSWGNVFLSAAYACSPAPIKAIQTFTSIRIVSTSEITLVDANDLIKVGDDISDRFIMSHGYEINFKPIGEFIDQLIIYDNDLYRLRLKEKPDKETVLKFDIIITLSDGKLFELKDELLTLI